ncbi:hypothetical protein FRC19_009434 [Serendipita sp. 401]|nr:hypothetical protein FRC19_009434 [Serendipita sp. 401]
MLFLPEPLGLRGVILSSGLSLSQVPQSRPGGINSLLSFKAITVTTLGPSLWKVKVDQADEDLCLEFWLDAAGL